MISLHSNRNPNKVTILWKIATKPYSLIWPLSSSRDWLSKYWNSANKISYVAIKLHKQIKWFVLTRGSPFIFLIYYFPQNTRVSFYPEAVLWLLWPKAPFLLSCCFTFSFILCLLYLPLFPYPLLFVANHSSTCWELGLGMSCDDSKGSYRFCLFFYMSMYLSWWNQTRKLINWVVPIEDTVSIHFWKSIPKTDRMTSVGTKTMGSDTLKIYFYNTKVNYCNISQFTSLNHFTVAFRIYRKHLHVPIHNKWHHQHTGK